MSSQLYSDAILATARARHGHGRLDHPDGTATCDNPLCGDRVTVDVRLAGAGIAALAQLTRGCVLTQAAASVLARHLPGASPADLAAATAEVKRLLAGEELTPGWPELAMFAPVHSVRSRHECVLLPFEAAAAALADAGR
jgi:nitrogen fixation NifU-like protein